MSTQTPNLGLTKPAGNEKPQVSVINGNSDILDAAIGDVDVSTDGSLQSQVDALFIGATYSDLNDLKHGVAGYNLNVLNTPNGYGICLALQRAADGNNIIQLAFPNPGQNTPMMWRGTLTGTSWTPWKNVGEALPSL